MRRRPKPRLAASRDASADPAPPAAPIITPLQRALLQKYAAEAEARARDPDVVPVDLTRVWHPRRR
jgi:hypothetical protein